MCIDSLFSEQELLVRQTARRFVDERVLPVIKEHFRAATFPKELIAEMGQLGFFGANLEGYGCAGMSNVEYGLVMQEVERGDSGLRSFVSVQGALVMYPILSYGSDEQKEKWLPLLQSGKAVGCFGLTEPDFGSNPAGMRTTARRDGADWVLNGEKTWITNGSAADIAIVWARAGDGVVYGYLVERGTPGYTTSDIHGKWSMRASVTSSLSFADRQSVNMIGALVRFDGFQIAEVAHDGIFVGDSVGAQQIAAEAGTVQRHRHVIALEHGNVRRFELAAVLQAAGLHGE